LENPDIDWKRAAFSQYPRGWEGAEGYSVRTREWRYTEWRRYDDESLVTRELYHTAVDPIETKNLVNVPEHQEIQARMQKILHDGWKKALPVN
jgi:iduronate 2-sulfatase